MLSIACFISGASVAYCIEPAIVLLAPVAVCCCCCCCCCCGANGAGVEENPPNKGPAAVVGAVDNAVEANPKPPDPPGAAGATDVVEPKNPPAELLGPGAAPKRPVEAGGACAPLKLNADVGGLDTAAGAPGAPPPPPKEKAPLGAGAGAPNEKFDMAAG